LLAAGEGVGPLAGVVGDADPVQGLHGRRLGLLRPAAEYALQEGDAAQRTQGHVGEQAEAATRLNCWAMNPMRMRASRTLSLSRPLTCTFRPKASITPGPESMVWSPSTDRSRVDLPEPEGPISATISPRATSRETPSSARREPKVLETERIDRTASVVMAFRQES